MARFYRILTKKDCKELDIPYSCTQTIVLSEYNFGHYSITRYTSTLGKIALIMGAPFFVLAYCARAMKECFIAIYDTWKAVDRREIYGDDNKIICYVKENE